MYVCDVCAYLSIDGKLSSSGRERWAKEGIAALLLGPCIASYTYRGRRTNLPQTFAAELSCAVQIDCHTHTFG